MNNQKTILIVDDASLVRLYCRSILEPAGFKIEEAFNGVEALEKVQAVAIDLLIVDINMPLMDGLTFVRTLRQMNSPVASIPALVTSSESGTNDFAAARAAGANHYLVKPIDRESLVDFARLFCGLPR